MSALAALTALRKTGMMPIDGAIYLGLGFRPRKRNALALDPENLPTVQECHAVAGLDVVLIYRGHLVRYGLLRQITGSICQAHANRLIIVDCDYTRTAFLKTVNEAWKL